MGEIVYDLAPGVSRMLFGAGLLVPVAKANTIDQMVARGAKVRRLRRASKVDATLDVTLSNAAVSETFSDDVAIRR